MKITDIKQQLKQKERYSIFVDDKYSFSLFGIELSSEKLRLGMELDDIKILELKKLSGIGKLYNRTLNLLAARERSTLEIRQYLRRKEAAHEDIELIVERLARNRYIDDERFAKLWVENRRRLKKRSNRLLKMELMQKGIAKDTISLVLEDSLDDELTALRELIIKKRRQSRYGDDQKLLAFLMRQGFNYSAARSAMDETPE